ncbi:chitin synthase-domain-containing protein [Penicillium taxi]|uniref:chitin synthase-domain-containing protein n=1 Tax=Penicillium taxi TaxID=168475 RepID=UPI002545AAC6|nr:chitin synthase-domain-containing protein [Penicillium taxi]KAJ5893741.1 chitin synthase-domain-containing protein [Penicillium taxi]
MYTIQAGNPERVHSYGSSLDPDMEAQSSIALPSKSLQAPVNSTGAHNFISPKSFFTVPITPPESTAGSVFGDEIQQEASSSTPSLGTASRVSSRTQASIQTPDITVPSRVAYTLEEHGDGRASPEDDQGTSDYFSPRVRRNRDLVAPKPWANTSLPTPSAQEDLSETEAEEASALPAVEAPTAQAKVLPAHAQQRNVGPAIDDFMDCVTTVAPKPRPEDTPTIRKRGRRTIVAQKHITQFAILGINGLCIFSTWWWTRYYYVLLPFITATVALNIFMIVSIVFNTTRRRIFPEKQTMPEKPETLIMVIPCYNETEEEMIKSMDSLIAQTNIDQHPRAIMIICDGKVRGPGMEKSTADYLFEDILLEKDYRVRIPAAYLAWDQEFMDIEVQKGTYKGVPYFCIVKQQNQGKRDSLIVIRSFLYNFNIRNQRPETVFSSKFFAYMASFISGAGIEYVDHLIGMDADTVFDKNCINELLLESRYENTVGVCGYVAVDWKNNNFDPWRLYQSAEYTIAQGLRRLHQSIVTHKVSCLPGCCQLLKICEETCGPEVLIDKFGYCPTLTDGLLTQIRATASEDRNHVCHMLSARPKVQTRQALKAMAVTDVPHSWSVFLSQRRRWTLGATSNDLLLITAPGVQWFERILATVNVFTWFLNLFIFASLASFITAAMSVPPAILMAFVSVMLIPVTYYFCIPLWLCKKWLERFQFWLGCAMYIVCGPFLNISVLLYACWYMDSFGWGKTRKVITEPEEGKENQETPSQTQTQTQTQTPNQPLALEQAQPTLPVIHDFAQPISTATPSRI